MKRKMLKGLLILAAAIGWGACQENPSTRLITGRIPVSGGGELYYEEQGSGEPLLLLHGHSLDRRMWDRQFDIFAEHYRTIRLDFRGYGLSSDQDETLPFTHMEDLLTLMDSLGIDRAHIVGLSMGSFIGGDLLAMHPERIRSCVLASGGIRSTPGPHVPVDSAEAARRDREIAELKAKGVEAMKAEWLETLMASGGSRREEMREPLRQMIADWSAWQALHKEVRLYWGQEAWAALKEQCPEVPTLMVRGANDYRRTEPYHPNELDYLPNGRAVLLPDCGHMLNMEQPEAFNRMVLEFLAEHSEAPEAD